MGVCESTDEGERFSAGQVIREIRDALQHHRFILALPAASRYFETTKIVHAHRRPQTTCGPQLRNACALRWNGRSSRACHTSDFSAISQLCKNKHHVYAPSQALHLCWLTAPGQKVPHPRPQYREGMTIPLHSNHLWQLNWRQRQPASAEYQVMLRRCWHRSNCFQPSRLSGVGAKEWASDLNVLSKIYFYKPKADNMSYFRRKLQLIPIKVQSV